MDEPSPMDLRHRGRPGSLGPAIAAGLLAGLVLVASADAAPAEPSGPHPRIFLDAELRAAWRRQASTDGSAVSGAIARCERTRTDRARFGRDTYMGLDWASYLASCLIAYAATNQDQHARTALLYFTALLDDLENVGDGKGGDAAARRDSGYAIRALGVYTALAYDWLHDHPGMSEPLRARARQRFRAWTDWFLEKGYRARNPGSNYQAGYLMAATLIAIAEGGEAGADGTRLWRLVVDELWGKDMAQGLAPGGILEGGDWAEGWQYGPLSVAEYALASRALHAQGVAIPGMEHWLEAVLVRFVHSLTPGGQMYVGGDTDEDTPTLPAHLMIPAGVVIGDAPPWARRQALAEIRRLRLAYPEHPLYGSLAEGQGLEPEPVARDRWPTFYRARGIGTFYARSDWSPRAAWFVMTCRGRLETDHMAPDAGSFVLSRGSDDVIVDPSPYGSLSSLTSNAPTVDSAQFPAEYRPSQAYYGQTTAYPWAHQSRSGIITARCDYADQYRYRDQPSDVPAAVRDVVVWPHRGDVTTVIFDRAESGDRRRPLHLRFRSLGSLALRGDEARATVGKSTLTIRRVASSSGKPEVRAMPRSDCFQPGITRGGCDAARFPIGEYRLVVSGPSMTAWHVIDAAAQAPDAAPSAISGAGFTGVSAPRGDGGLVVVTGGTKSITVPVPRRGTLVVLDGPDGHASGAVAGDGCAVTVGASSGTALSVRPWIVSVNESCTVTADPPLLAGAGAPAAVSDGPVPATAAAHGGGDERGAASPRSRRAGCCGAQSTPGSPLAMSLVVLVGLGLVLRRR